MQEQIVTNPAPKFIAYEESASCQMNNLTLSNLTNVNPLLFTHPEGGNSSSN